MKKFFDRRVLPNAFSAATLVGFFTPRRPSPSRVLVRGDAVFQELVEDLPLGKQPVAVHAAQLVLIMAVAAVIGPPVAGVVVELEPEGAARGAVAVHLDHDVGDEVAEPCRPARRVHRLAPGERGAHAGDFLLDRRAALDDAARPVEHPVLGEGCGIGRPVLPIEREQIARLQILDLGAVAGVVLVVGDVLVGGRRGALAKRGRGNGKRGNGRDGGDQSVHGPLPPNC